MSKYSRTKETNLYTQHFIVLDKYEKCKQRKYIVYFNISSVIIIDQTISRLTIHLRLTLTVLGGVFVCLWFYFIYFLI